MSLESIDTGLRHVQFLELLEIDGWRLKLYGMGLTPAPPAESFVEEGRQLIAGALPYPAQAKTRHGVGFATLHAGEQGNYLLLNWWESGDLLKQHLFGASHNAASHNAASHDAAGPLTYGWPRGIIGCIWEMAVPWFERNAWYRHALSRLEAPDLDAYLATRLEGTI